MPQLTLAQAFARAPAKKDRSAKKPRLEDTPRQVKFSLEASSSSSQPATPSNKSRLPRHAREKILFGSRGPHPELDQFALQEVEHQGLRWPTSQHLFQGLKFLGIRPDLAEAVRKEATADGAFKIAHAHQSSARSDWFSVNISMMEEALFLRFSQHAAAKAVLLATDDAELYQDSTTDSFWGVGSDLLGSNEYGRALERVRERLGGLKTPTRTITQCKNCGKKPRIAESLYCGTVCLKADIMHIPPLCPQCRRRPQVGKLGYCGQTCLTKATAK